MAQPEPSVPRSIDRLSPALTAIVAAAAAQLSSEGRAVGRIVSVAPGANVAEDECCEGFLYSRVVAVQARYGANARHTASGAYCSPLSYQVSAVLGIRRCAAVVDDRGISPKPEEITADGREGLADLSTLLAVLCSLTGIDSIGLWEPVGPEGGCHGGEWSFTLSLPA